MPLCERRTWSTFVAEVGRDLAAERSGRCNDLYRVVRPRKIHSSGVSATNTWGPHGSDHEDLRMRTGESQGLARLTAREEWGKERQRHRQVGPTRQGTECSAKAGRGNGSTGPKWGVVAQ